MSFDPHIVPRITLLDKTQLNRTHFAVLGDGTVGNLNRHRKEGAYTFTGVRKTRHGTITLRAKDGLFITKEPIMTRDVDFTKYLIEVQFVQPSKSGDTGHPDPIGREGEVVRYDISEPQQGADEKGQTLTITLTGIENRLRQSLDSESHRLETHKQSFLRRMVHYGVTRGLGSPSFTQTPAEIKLPDGKVKLDWIPGGPVPTHDLLVDNIDSLKEPAVIGGDFDDFYYYFTNSTTITNNLEVKAEIFGARNATDRGEQEIILKPVRTASTDTYEKKHTVITANTAFRNVFITRGSNGAHSWPMEYSVFASDWEHAKISADWSSGAVEYEKGDYVKFGGQLHKANDDHTSGIGEEPIPDTNDHWDNLSTLNTHSPLTNDTDIWLANLDAKQEPFVAGVSGGINADGFHRGFCVDMNICVTHYDVTSSQDPYEAVSGKDVEKLEVGNPTSLTAAEIVDGFRVGVSAAPAGDFTGHANQIAEWNEFKESGAGWEFSATPVADEYVNDRSLGRIIKFTTSWQIGSPSWTLAANNDRASPFHPVKDITLISGPEGRPNSAIQWEFDWRAIPAEGGDERNRASRWAGFSLKLPIPHRAFGGLAVGDIFNNATMDFENLSRNPDGTISDWNKGSGTENLGNLRGVACKLALGFEDSSGNDIDGLANMVTIWWFRDKFNHTVYTTAKVRRVGQFVTIKFDAGPQAKMQIHENRVEELFQIATDNISYVFPFNDHLTEKEYSGIRFNWNFVKEMGMFFKGSYDDNFFYKNAQNSFVDRFLEDLQQVFLGEIGSIITGRIGNFVIDKCLVKLAEFRFIKDAYVSSASGVTADARVSRAVASNQFDYQTLQDIGIGKVRRTEHYPQFTPVTSYVDVRMRLGERFKASGPRWSDEVDRAAIDVDDQTFEREMVCAEYTIFEADNGSRQQSLGYTRFGQF